MSNELIPWHDDDIFHDDVVTYVLPDFFPLSSTTQSQTFSTGEAEDLWQ